MAIIFYVGCEILFGPIHISTLGGDLVVAKRVHRNCLIYVSHRFTNVDHIDSDMYDLYVICAMD